MNWVLSSFCCIILEICFDFVVFVFWRGDHSISVARKSESYSDICHSDYYSIRYISLGRPVSLLQIWKMPLLYQESSNESEQNSLETVLVTMRGSFIHVKIAMGLNLLALGRTLYATLNWIYSYITPSWMRAKLLKETFWNSNAFQDVLRI